MMKDLSQIACTHAEAVEVRRIPCHCKTPREKVIVKCDVCGEVAAAKCGKYCVLFEKKNIGD